MTKNTGTYGSDNHNNVRIGKDGRIYVDGTATANPGGGGSAGSGQNGNTPNASDDSSGCGCLLLIIIAIVVVLLSTSAIRVSGCTRSAVDVVAQNGSPITLEGVVKREEQTKSQTGMGWSRVVYYLDLDNPINLTYTDGFGDTAQARMERIAVEVLEQYGSEADHNLDLKISSKWQRYVGDHVEATGCVYDTGNAHTVGDAMLDVSSVSRTS